MVIVYKIKKRGVKEVWIEEELEQDVLKQGGLKQAEELEQEAEQDESNGKKNHLPGSMIIAYCFWLFC